VRAHAEEKGNISYFTMLFYVIQKQNKNSKYEKIKPWEEPGYNGERVTE